MRNAVYVYMYIVVCGAPKPQRRAQRHSAINTMLPGYTLLYPHIAPN